MHRTDKYSKQISLLASFGKWLSVHLQTKWLWVLISLPLKPQIWCLLRARSSLAFRQTIVCEFKLKLVRDIITYSQMRRTDKYSNTAQSFDQFD